MTPRSIARARLMLVAAGVLFAAACASGASSSDAAPAVAAVDLARHEAEIAAFEASDRANPPAPGGVVFAGSSSFRLWPDLRADFAGTPVLNRGFGGSTFPELLRYAPRMVLPYAPRLVVVYEGDNDIAEGRTPAQVAADYAAFVRLVRQSHPRARIAYVAIKPSPSRWHLVARQREANRLVREQIARDSLQTYVDVFTPMLGANGRPRPALFREDSLHMTPAGYAIWTERLRPVVR